MTQGDTSWIIKAVLILLVHWACLCYLFNVSSVYSFGKLFAFGMTAVWNTAFSDQQCFYFFANEKLILKTMFHLLSLQNKNIAM